MVFFHVEKSAIGISTVLSKVIWIFWQHLSFFFSHLIPMCTSFFYSGFCQENPLVIANTLFQQHKRRLYTWTSPDGQYQNQIDCIICSKRWRSSIQPAKTRLGADCGSVHALLIGKFRLKLKKVGKTTRPFRYDLNQIPYDYTLEVRNWFKEIDLIECLMNYGWRFVTLYRRQGSRPSPWKRNAKG